MKNKKLVLAALFAALTCVATFLVRIPSVIGGYINLGDGMVLLSGWLLGPVGALAAAVGSALADISAGYIIYAPVTFLIKGLMALVAYWALKGIKGNKITANVISGVLSEIIMIAGYFVFEWIIYDFGGGIANIPANAVQAVAGIVAATLLYSVFKRNIEKLFEDK